jgi:hypothetical protein
MYTVEKIKLLQGRGPVLRSHATTAKAPWTCVAARHAAYALPPPTPACPERWVAVCATMALVQAHFGVRLRPGMHAHRAEAWPCTRGAYGRLCGSFESRVMLRHCDANQRHGKLL